MSLWGSEGIRDLIHLNPIEFQEDSEVLAALPERLRAWKNVKSSGVELQLSSEGNKFEQNHTIRTLVVRLVNDSSHRITNYDCKLCIPASILRHWTTSYSLEVKSDDSNRRCFGFTERNYGPLAPGETKQMLAVDYCTACAAGDPRYGGIGAAVGEEIVDAKMWIEGREYAAENTIKGLSIDAERRGAYG